MYGCYGLVATVRLHLHPLSTLLGKILELFFFLSLPMIYIFILYITMLGHINPPTVTHFDHSFSCCYTSILPSSHSIETMHVSLDQSPPHRTHFSQNSPLESHFYLQFFVGFQKCLDATLKMINPSHYLVRLFLAKLDLIKALWPPTSYLSR